jgi:hypothetical protein
MTNFKFKLSTTSKATGRIKGWNAPSDLSRTVSAVLSRKDSTELEALKAAINKELVKAESKEAEYYAQLSTPAAAKGTRFGDRAAAGYDRACSKTSNLKMALKELA